MHPSIHAIVDISHLTSLLNLPLPPPHIHTAMVCMQDVVVDTRLGGPLDGQQQARLPPKKHVKTMNLTSSTMQRHCR
jgi:hypothetical protein